MTKNLNLKTPYACMWNWMFCKLHVCPSMLSHLGDIEVHLMGVLALGKLDRNMAPGISSIFLAKGGRADCYAGHHQKIQISVQK